MAPHTATGGAGKVPHICSGHEISLHKVVPWPVGPMSNRAQQPWGRSEEGTWSPRWGAGAQWWERIEGDDNRAARGVQEQSWAAPARAVWLRACALALHWDGRFQECYNINLEHGDSRDKKRVQTDATVRWYSNGG